MTLILIRRVSSTRFKKDKNTSTNINNYIRITSVRNMTKLPCHQLIRGLGIGDLQ
jgi:hypothetical protein